MLCNTVFFSHPGAHSICGHLPRTCTRSSQQHSSMNARGTVKPHPQLRNYLHCWLLEERQEFFLWWVARATMVGPTPVGIKTQRVIHKAGGGYLGVRHGGFCKRSWISYDQDILCMYVKLSKITKNSLNVIIGDTEQ